MLHSRLTRLTLCFSATLVVGCASNSAARRATIITDADRAAKAVLERENAIDVAKIPARAFAVVPFTMSARDTLLEPLAFGLPALLANDLAVSPELQLVERVQLAAMLRELKLVDDGIVDPRQAPRVGRLVGARRLLIGTVSRSNDNTIRLNVRVVDVLSGTVQEVAAAEAPINRVLDAEKALALLIFERLGITLTPAQRVRVEERQTTQLAALVAFGRGVESDAKGDWSGATKAYQEATQLDGKFVAARTSKVLAAVAPHPRVTNLERVLGFSAQALNMPVPTKTTEVADAPLASSSGFSLIFIIRVTP